MPASIITAAVGLLIAILGITNMRGNISTIHEYHRKRVSEENKKIFGKLVGLGTLIIGIGCILFGVLLLIFELTQQDIFSIIATAELIVSLIVGLILSFYAMIKYNGGIF